MLATVNARAQLTLRIAQSDNCLGAVVNNRATNSPPTGNLFFGSNNNHVETNTELGKDNMKTNCIIVIWLAVLAVATTGWAQTFTLLHSFAGAPNEEANPSVALRIRAVLNCTARFFAAGWYAKRSKQPVNNNARWPF
jgi:hypothetical protein